MSVIPIFNLKTNSLLKTMQRYDDFRYLPTFYSKNSRNKPHS